jgi:hypothetical protein
MSICAETTDVNKITDIPTINAAAHLFAMIMDCLPLPMSPSQRIRRFKKPARQK